MRRLPILFAALLVADAAHAAEVVFEGAYRGRARFFDTLSMDRDLALSEGSALYAQHRLWLRPRFLLSEQVQATVEILALDNVLWGTRQAPVDVGVPGAPPVFEDRLTAPVSLTDPTANLLDVTLWRAWGDLYTRFGRFSVGRMPLHWGRGIWQNNGQTVRPHFADFGDTVDRVQWEYLIQDQVFLRAAVDVVEERFLNLEDDTTAWNLVAAYRSEQVVAGLNTRLRNTRHDDADDFNLFTADLAAEARLGQLTASAEVVGQFGGGDLAEGINDVTVMAFGAVVNLGLDLNLWGVEIEGGFASGDGDPRDTSIRTFTFDRDYSVGLILFEQPLPTLASAIATDTTGSRTFEFAQTGNAVSNALYLRPKLSRTIVEGLDAEALLLAARAAKLPETATDRSPAYGLEFDLGLRYTGIEHVEILGMGALFLPGDYYTPSTLTDLRADFDGPVWGAQLSTRIFF